MGARVEVKFGDGLWYGGTVRSILTASQARGLWVKIKFDDGDINEINWNKGRKEEWARMEGEDFGVEPPKKPEPKMIAPTAAPKKEKKSLVKAAAQPAAAQSSARSQGRARLATTIYSDASKMQPAKKARSSAKVKVAVPAEKKPKGKKPLKANKKGGLINFQKIFANGIK
jgi:hypothetical protein